MWHRRWWSATNPVPFYKCPRISAGFVGFSGTFASGSAPSRCRRSWTKKKLPSERQMIVCVTSGEMLLIVERKEQKQKQVPISVGTYTNTSFGFLVVIDQIYEAGRGRITWSRRLVLIKGLGEVWSIDFGFASNKNGSDVPLATLSATTRLYKHYIHTGCHR